MKDMTPEQLLEAAENAVESGELEKMLDGEELNPAEDGGEENKPTDEAGGEQAQANAEPEHPEGAPIASKSGAYTIPYEELAKARERAKAALSWMHWPRSWRHKARLTRILLPPARCWLNSSASGLRWMRPV